MLQQLYHGLAALAMPGQEERLPPVEMFHVVTERSHHILVRQSVTPVYLFFRLEPGIHGNLPVIRGIKIARRTEQGRSQKVRAFDQGSLRGVVHIHVEAFLPVGCLPRPHAGRQHIKHVRRLRIRRGGIRRPVPHGSRSVIRRIRTIFRNTLSRTSRKGKAENRDKKPPERHDPTHIQRYSTNSKIFRKHARKPGAKLRFFHQYSVCTGKKQRVSRKPRILPVKPLRKADKQQGRLTTDTGYPLRIPDTPASANLLQPALPGILSARHG